MEMLVGITIATIVTATLIYITINFYDSYNSIKKITTVTEQIILFVNLFNNDTLSLNYLEVSDISAVLENNRGTFNYYVENGNIKKDGKIIVSKARNIMFDVEDAKKGSIVTLNCNVSNYNFKMAGCFLNKTSDSIITDNPSTGDGNGSEYKDNETKKVKKRGKKK